MRMLRPRTPTPAKCRFHSTQPEVQRAVAAPTCKCSVDNWPQTSRDKSDLDVAGLYVAARHQGADLEVSGRLTRILSTAPAILARE